MEIKEAQERQVIEQVDKLQNELTRLNDEISNLRDRLSPVLRERQLAVKKEESVDSVLVPLASSLRGCVNRTNTSVLGIAEIINLLEV